MPVAALWGYLLVSNFCPNAFFFFSSRPLWIQLILYPNMLQEMPVSWSVHPWTSQETVYHLLLNAEIQKALGNKCIETVQQTFLNLQDLCSQLEFSYIFKIKVGFCKFIYVDGCRVTNSFILLLCYRRSITDS